MQTILRNTETLLSVTLYLDEVATNATGAVTATVTADDGSLISTGAATNAGTGVYTFVLSPQANLDYLTVSWAGSVGGFAQTVETQVEIVGGYLASLTDIRALDTVSNATKYPTAMVRDARNQAEGLFERYTNQTFVPRYGRWKGDGNGTHELYLPVTDLRRLVRVHEDGVLLDTSGWLPYEDGRIRRPNDAFSVINYANLDIVFEYGKRYVPDEIRRAFLIYVRFLLLEQFNRVNDRSTNMTADGVTYALMQAGPNRPTGLPAVDAVLNQWKAPKAASVGGWADVDRRITNPAYFWGDFFRSDFQGEVD